jgi:hypothetical protein
MRAWIIDSMDRASLKSGLSDSAARSLSLKWYSKGFLFRVRAMAALSCFNLGAWWTLASHHFQVDQRT